MARIFVVSRSLQDHFRIPSGRPTHGTVASVIATRCPLKCPQIGAACHRLLKPEDAEPPLARLFAKLDYSALPGVRRGTATHLLC